MSIFPNSLTIGNMFFGFWSILSAVEGNYIWAAYFVMLGGVCDALDGKVARLVKSTSDFGVEFDSLAGMVVATNAGEAQIIVTWVNGEISGSLDITVSDETFTGFAEKAPQITLYPNPNDGLLYIECDQQIPLTSKILDLGGKLLLEARFTGNTTLDTRRLSSGTYLVVHTGQDLVLRHKLIIQ